MELIKEEKIDREISGLFVYDFTLAENGLYLIEIIASAKSWWQNLKNFKSFFSDDDLAIKIDGLEFLKQSGKAGLFDAEMAWNGNQLKGLSKTALVAVFLNVGAHKISFLNNIKPFVKNIKISKIEEENKAEFTIKIGNTLFYNIKQNAPGGFIKLFSFILLIAIMAAGLLICQQLKKEVKAQDAAQNVKYRHYFINPKDEEINVLDLDEAGKIVGSRQLTFDQYPKSHLEVFDKNNLIGYFQNVEKRHQPSPVNLEEYYKNYVKLMIKRGENETPYEIYRGDAHTSYWEWRDNEHAIIYYNCGTYCLHYYVININTKEVEYKGTAYE